VTRSSLTEVGPPKAAPLATVPGGLAALGNAARELVVYQRYERLACGPRPESDTLSPCDNLEA
jgi:hypothetical protein